MLIAVLEVDLPRSSVNPPAKCTHVSHSQTAYRGGHFLSPIAFVVQRPIRNVVQMSSSRQTRSYSASHRLRCVRAGCAACIWPRHRRLRSSTAAGLATALISPFTPITLGHPFSSSFPDLRTTTTPSPVHPPIS
ncbi:uncharacterized protein SCHCODRAFT_02342615 [Schizophyllum commune H4-8]|uniref:Expressed protein n=1 Tax=Schizophyllum commune (strain H4-8 / FGSC 9210) TaxID=578458 RepID=D8Q9N7_SCHCM|nr:uncharacterized protein SCHCODRAFT_02342615 [Schizophyllum commune H4-8]KAI5890344.1 hypothetical protein SCHCODRAFT_02342615 [Schizophyllum commune H4-8]